MRALRPLAVVDQSAGLQRVLVAIAVALIFSLDLHPFTPNDTAKYLLLGRSLLDEGLVSAGFQQPGYPATLRTAQALSDMVGVSPFELMAFFQRLAILVAVLAIILQSNLAGLFSTATFLTPYYLSTTNILYPFATLVPTMIFAGLSLNVARNLGPSAKRSFYLCVFVLLGLFCASIKLSTAWIFLGLAPFWEFGSPWRIRSNWIAASAIVALTMLAIGMSIENKREFGRFFPLTNTARTSYVLAWDSLREDLKDDPKMKDHYESESPYPFVYSIERDANLEAKEKNRILGRAVSSLAAASYGNSLLGRFVHAGKAFINFGVDDMNGARKKILDDQKLTGSKPGHLMNFYANQEGLPAFLQRYNAGVLPQTTDGWLRISGSAAPIAAVHFGGTLAILALASFSCLPFLSRTWNLSVAVVLGYFASSAILGLAFVDNWRYILPSIAFLSAASIPRWAIQHD